MGKYARLSLRDHEILYFIWRWKFTTTNMVAARFYGSSSLFAAYFRLWRLANAGILSSIVTLDGQNHFWTLTKKSFEIVKERLPPLEQVGFMSENFRHDLIVNAAHLGQWLIELPAGFGICTEQELRRISREYLPDWVPSTLLHRPDGYWHINDSPKNRLVALEVELSQKNREIYDNNGIFYTEDTKCTDVIWIVSKPQLARSIQAQVSKRYNSRGNIHSFILLSDFISQHWQAPVVLGKSIGKTMSELLATSPQPPCNQDFGRHFFDTRKKPINSAIPPKFEDLVFVD